MVISHTLHNRQKLRIEGGILLTKYDSKIANLQ